MNTIKMWFAMKKKEIEFKFMFYTYGVKFMDEKEELVKNVHDIIMAVQGTTPIEIRDSIIDKIAVLAHEQAEKERKKEKTDVNE